MGRVANFDMAQWARLQFYCGAIGKAAIFTTASRQGLSWASQAMHAMPDCLVDNTWTSFGTTDMVKSVAKDLRHHG